MTDLARAGIRGHGGGAFGRVPGPGPPGAGGEWDGVGCAGGGWVSVVGGAPLVGSPVGALSPGDGALGGVTETDGLGSAERRSVSQ